MMHHLEGKIISQITDVGIHSVYGRNHNDETVCERIDYG